MTDKIISEKELTENRTPSELWNWLVDKVKQICSTEEGLKDFRLQKGLVKQLVGEIAPLAIFGRHKFGDTDQVLLQPIIGNQLNFEEEFIGVKEHNVFPLLARFDQVVRYERQKFAYEGYKVYSINRGHFTGALDIAALRRHILWCTRET